MKIRITLKDPDGVGDSIRESAKASLPAGLDQDETETLLEKREEKVQESIKPWVQYREYVTIEIDTETQTASVLKVGS